MSNNNKSTVEQKRTILDLPHSEARQFFIKHESYCSFDLPPYILVNSLLKKINSFLEICSFFEDNKLCEKPESKPSHFDNINHIILHNKDGKYAWRPLQLIHPALYVSLVHRITEEANWKIICKRFNKFSEENTKIKCMSIPVIPIEDKKQKAEQITHWLKKVEQKSIEMFLEYKYLIHTDISNCYGSLYTHSIAWAIHDKETMKENLQKRNKGQEKLIGNIIDKQLRNMSHGQTNGIPQGSVLMDFIAEMVLGYIDYLLTKKITNIKDYYIVRYRDDYRVFTNSLRDGEEIIKCMAEILIPFGMTLNPNKTKPTDQIIKGSIKPEKLHWLQQKQSMESFKEHLLLIHNFAMKFPNSNSLNNPLMKYYNRISSNPDEIENAYLLINIISDIAYHNPQTYSVSVGIMSKLIEHIHKSNQKEVVKKIRKKFERIPNTGYLDIWLQRAVFGFDESISFNEPICQLVANEDNISIWESKWLRAELKEQINAKTIIDQKELNEIKGLTIQKEEISTFPDYPF